MLEVSNLVKVFKGELLEKDKVALNELSFKLRKGRITGFLGHNGSGKTTLLKVAMGFISPTSGNINFDRSLGTTRKEIFRNIGYMPERPYFYPHLKGEEFLRYMTDLTGKDWSRAKELVKEYGERLDIVQALGVKIKSYSKGMLQRVGFLANIICEPQFIILDEPLSGLDPIGRKEYKEIIKEINAKGTTIFFSSHIVHDVEEISRDLVVIEKGKLVFNGEIEELYNQNKVSSFQVKYFKNGEIARENCEEHEIGSKLEELRKNKFQLYEVARENMSLEEIVYRLNS